MNTWAETMVNAWAELRICRLMLRHYVTILTATTTDTSNLVNNIIARVLW